MPATLLLLSYCNDSGMESFIHVRACGGSSNASKESSDPKVQRRTES
jgi:hypothetical protein